ncbi:MAG: hypothetical protein EZS28_038331, partial [Streblomastix strix]
FFLMFLGDVMLPFAFHIFDSHTQTSPLNPQSQVMSSHFLYHNQYQNQSNFSSYSTQQSFALQNLISQKPQPIGIGLGAQFISENSKNEQKVEKGNILDQQQRMNISFRQSNTSLAFLPPNIISLLKSNKPKQSQTQSNQNIQKNSQFNVSLNSTPQDQDSIISAITSITSDPLNLDSSLPQFGTAAQRMELNRYLQETLSNVHMNCTDLGVTMIKPVPLSPITSVSTAASILGNTSKDNLVNNISQQITPPQTFISPDQLIYSYSSTNAQNLPISIVASGHTLLLLSNSIRLTYKSPQLIRDSIITPSVLAQYNSIFSLLLRLKLANWATIRAELPMTLLKIPSFRTAPVIRRLTILRHRIRQLVHAIDGAFLTLALEYPWQQLCSQLGVDEDDLNDQIIFDKEKRAIERKLQMNNNSNIINGSQQWIRDEKNFLLRRNWGQCQSVSDVQHAHEAYLNSIIERCALGQNAVLVQTTIQSIVVNTLKLYDICVDVMCDVRERDKQLFLEREKMIISEDERRESERRELITAKAIQDQFQDQQDQLVRRKKQKVKQIGSDNSSVNWRNQREIELEIKTKQILEQKVILEEKRHGRFLGNFSEYYKNNHKLFSTSYYRYLSSS